MTRRMVRDFDPEPLPDGLVRRALRRAMRAPSAGFTQGWDFVVLGDSAARERFWEAATPAPTPTPTVGPGGPEQVRRRWLSGVRRAPVLVVVCANPQAYVRRYARVDKAAVGLGEREGDWPVPYWDVDAGMAALIMLLSAVDDGVGGLFFGVPAARHEAVRDALDIPPDRRIVGVVALGRPRSAPGRGAPRGGPAGASSGASSGARPGTTSVRPRARRYEEVVHDGRFGVPPSP